MENSNLQTEILVKQESQQNAKGLVSRILTILLTLFFFLPWFTFRACNMTYEYSGYKTVIFQPSNDIIDIGKKMSKFDKDLSDKNDVEASNKSWVVNDFTIISYVAVLIALMLLLAIFYSYFKYNEKAITISSSVKSLLFLIIIAILFYDKSNIPTESKGMFEINVEFGLILSFIISTIMIFNKKIESGLIISDPNSIVTKMHEIFQKKFIGFIGIGIMILGLLLAFLSGGLKIGSSEDSVLDDKSKLEDNNSNYDINKKELELKQKELELKEKEFKLKEQELNKQNQTYNQSGVPGNYPEASLTYLNRSDLAGMSKYSLKIMRNEIFARHGYIFKTYEMRNYFSNQSWYIPRYDNVDEFLTSIEKANIDLIKSFEQ